MYTAPDGSSKSVQYPTNVVLTCNGEVWTISTPEYGPYLPVQHVHAIWVI